MRRLLVACVALVFVLAGRSGAEALDPENTLYIDLDAGRVVVELYPELAPRHVERVKTLAEEGFYDGVVFHRVIEGFMAQTGDPTGTGQGGSDYPDLPAEFSDRSFQRGTLGMARASAPDSANSQFFIMFDEAPHLDGQYTVFGQVIEGMEHVDAIKRGDPARNGMVDDPDRMLRVQLAAEAD